MIKLKIPCEDERKAYQRAFEIISFLSDDGRDRLTESEIMVLVEHLMLPDKYEHHRFSSTAKRKVMDAIEERGDKLSRTNLNNKIYEILRKGYLVREDDNVIALSPPALRLYRYMRSCLREGKPIELKYDVYVYVEKGEDSEPKDIS